MKVERNGAEEFKPFSITLTLESEDEARAVYAIFNHTKNTNLFASGQDSKIRDALGYKYDPQQGEFIANGILYSSFWP